jgi:hypothetical protein
MTEPHLFTKLYHQKEPYTYCVRCGIHINARETPLVFNLTGCTKETPPKALDETR